MSKGKWVAAALGAVALLVSGCSSGTGAAPAAGPGGLTTIHVGVSAGASSSAPMYLAVEQGVFRNLGLDLQFEATNDGAVIVPRLMTGQLQFAMGSFGPFASAAEQGLPIRMIAGATRAYEGDNRFAAIIVPADSTATDMSAIHTFAVSETQRNPLDEMAVNGLNGDYAGPELVSVPLGSLGDVVGSGAAQAGRLFQPFLGRALDTGKVKVLRYIAPPLTPGGTPAAIFMGNETYLNANADLASRFVKGVEQAYSYAGQHLAEVAAYAPRTGLTDNPLKLEDMPNYQAGPLDPAKIDELLDLYVNGHYLQRDVSAADVTWTPPAGQ